MNIFLWYLTLLLFGGCEMSCGYQKNSAEFKLLSVCLFRPSCLPVDRRVQIFKAPFSGWREIFSLKCPSLWLSEITPHISSIREGKTRTKKESRWFSQHLTVNNTLNFLFVCVIGRICGLLIFLFSTSPNLTHLPYSHLICLLSIILIYLPSELQVESSQRFLLFFFAVGPKPDPLWKAFQDKQALNL